MKVFFRTIHLYLSLIAGLVIMIACFTGAILVFEKELQEAFNPGRYHVESLGERLPLDKLQEIVKQEIPDAKISGIKIYKDPFRTVEVSYTAKKGKQEAKEKRAVVKPEDKKGDKKKEGAERREPRKTAYVNPYTGQIVDLYDYRQTFFYDVFALHRWLLGGNDGIGKFIVGVSTFIFLFILLTGIILWWPRTKAILLQRLKIKTDGSWKRLNNDFHIVLGFYTAIFLFIFAFTGLSWSFKWFNKGIGVVTNSNMEARENPPASQLINGSKTSVEDVYEVINRFIPEASAFNISLPKDSLAVFSVSVNTKKETESDQYFIDQYSGKIVGKQLFADRNLGQKVRAKIKPVHTGSIFGAYSKIIAFIACIVGTSLPVTGVILWINRIRKRKKIKKEDFVQMEVI
ncbi:PepSY-associated TM helix domain-containing protein [Rubrolithibacter danxiaensis]|uniref:PepSY-associated TM helix domain-containing protein n=1 Tax=Rubrolithibacter danxiaensis TaxID=3390805 RepID=UPI003BF86573